MFVFSTKSLSVCQHAIQFYLQQLITVIKRFQSTGCPTLQKYFNIQGVQIYQNISMYRVYNTNKYFNLQGIQYYQIFVFIYMVSMSLNILIYRVYNFIKIFKQQGVQSNIISIGIYRKSKVYVILYLQVVNIIKII